MISIRATRSGVHLVKIPLQSLSQSFLSYPELRFFYPAVLHELEFQRLLILWDRVYASARHRTRSSLWIKMNSRSR